MFHDARRLSGAPSAPHGYFPCIFPRARTVQKLRAIVVKFFTSDGKFSFVKVGTQLVVLVALVLGSWPSSATTKQSHSTWTAK